MNRRLWGTAAAMLAAAVITPTAASAAPIVDWTAANLAGCSETATLYDAGTTLGAAATVSRCGQSTLYVSIVESGTTTLAQGSMPVSGPLTQTMTLTTRRIRGRTYQACFLLVPAWQGSCTRGYRIP